MEKKKVMALIAHDNKKADIVAWSLINLDKLKQFDLIGTGLVNKRKNRSFG